MTTEDKLKEAMLKYVPALADDYRRFVRRQFAAMVEDLGPTLKGVYSSKTWTETFSAIRRNLKQDTDENWYTVHAKDQPYYINEEALEKNAKAYGEEIALEWYNKMINKLGKLENVEVSDPKGSGGDVTIDAEFKGRKIHVDQQRIINVSPRGRLFHQWPSRIYVDKKFYPEEEYKKQAKDWGVPGIFDMPKIVTEYRCSHCGHTGRMGEFRGLRGHGLVCPKCQHMAIFKVSNGPGEGSRKGAIDVNTRPKKWQFEYKKDWVNVYNQAGTDTEQDTVSGYTQEEAIEKIRRHYNGWDYIKRVYNFRLLGVYSWNDQRLWGEKDGTPPPGPSRKPSAEESMEQAKDQKKKYHFDYTYDKSYGEHESVRYYNEVWAFNEDEARKLMQESLEHSKNLYTNPRDVELVSIWYKGRAIWRKPKGKKVTYSASSKKSGGSSKTNTTLGTGR